MRGSWRRLTSPDDVLELMDTTAEGVVACVADAGATFLAPIFDELAAVVCLSGTPLSHIGIVSREYQVPCVMAATLVERAGRRRRGRGRLLGRARRRADAVVTLDRAEIDRWIRYHSEISYALTTERTALESALIPVSAYILIACVECYRRYPEIIDEINRAMPPEELGRAGHRLTTQIDPVHLWAVPNFSAGRAQGAHGRRARRPGRRRAPARERSSTSGRAPRARTASTTARTRRPTPTARPRRTARYVDEIAAACEPVADPEQRARRSAGSTRCSRRTSSCSGSTPAPATRTPARTRSPTVASLLLRAYNRLGVSHFPWSAEVSAAMPHREVLGAFVLRDAQLRVTDFGTSVTQPEDYWPHVEAFAFFDVSSGALVPIDGAQRDALAGAAKSAQKQLYRKIAGMERRAKIDAGAYVYFTFLRPFAELAGVEIDWTVPRDSTDLYPFLELIDGSIDTAAGRAGRDARDVLLCRCSPLP